MTSDTSPSLRQSDAFSRKIQYRYKITSSLSRMMAHYLRARCRSSERGCKWRAAVFLRSIFSRESFALLISILRRKINVVAPLRREAVADAARAVAVVRILEVMNNEDDLKSVKKNAANVCRSLAREDEGDKIDHERTRVFARFSQEDRTLLLLPSSNVCLTRSRRQCRCRQSAVRIRRVRARPATDWYHSGPPTSLKRTLS